MISSSTPLLSILKDSFALLKKDKILCAPYLLFAIINSIFSTFILKNSQSFTTKELLYLLSQNILQSLCGCIVIIMISIHKKNDINIQLVLSIFKNKLKSLFILAFISNGLITSIFFIVTNIANSSSQSSLSTLATVVLFLIVSLSAIPFTAFSYFIFIKCIYVKQKPLNLLVDMLKSCFKEYKRSFKWFIGIFFIQSLQLFITLLIPPSFLLYNVVLSLTQAVTLTFSMIYSVLFYKIFIQSKQEIN